MNEKKANWRQILVIGVFWVLSGILGLIILGLGREVVLVVGVNTFKMNRWVTPFINNSYYFVAGLIWLGTFFFAEAYFTKGVQKNNIGARVARYIGIELLLIALNQAILMGYRWLPISALGIILTIAEVLVGVGLLALPRYLQLRQSQKPS